MPIFHTPATLRARLILVVAGLCGVAVAAGSTAAYTVTSAELRRQVDASLTQQTVANIPPELLCGGGPTFGGTARIVIRLQRVSSDGTVCNPDGSSALPVTPADLRVARSGTGGGLRDVTSDGVHLRLRTAPLPGGYAVQVARPLTETDAALRRLSRLFALTTLVALLGVGFASRVLVRRVLAPVGALTSAAEHIARTEDLDVPIDVHGRDEVARLASAFNRMIAALAASKRRQRELVADAGHELRTPLTSLRTNIELLQRVQGSDRPLSSTETNALYHDIQSQTEELTLLVSELVELARDERPDADSAPVRLDEIVARAAERAKPRAGLRQLDVGELPVVLVHGTAGMLERAIVNLLDNALKFSPETSSVQLALQQDGNVAHISIADQGPGVAEGDLPRVFDRFWRPDGSRGLPGSGLGLAIVQQTATAHGGRIALTPNDYGGTTATLTIPLLPESSADP